MKRIEKDFGALIYSEGRICDIEGGNTYEGVIFRDMQAFETGEGICYVSEYGLEEIWENLTDLEARYENSDMSEEEYLSERERIIIEGAETRQTIINQVTEAFGEEYMLTVDQVLYFAKEILSLAEWAYISTYLTENYDIDDSIESDDINGRGVYTEFQHEAIRNGMTPKEYSERQLSYSELAALDEEFDAAFIVDDDCLDDWSDKGLGANARITYIEERRTGMIDGPEQFDCPPQFVRK